VADDVEEVLIDEPDRRVVRAGATVQRKAQPWTPTIQDFLTHLNNIGFSQVPKPLGVSGEGLELLSYIPGDSGVDAWQHVVPITGLQAFADLVHRYHVASSSYHPRLDAVWPIPPSAREGEVISHNDLIPCNVVWDAGEPVGIIDWEFAAPGPAIDDVAYALEWSVPFRDDDFCRRWLRYDQPPDRRARLIAFAQAYGLTTTAGLVDAVIERMVETKALVQHLAAEGRPRQVALVAAGQLESIQLNIEWTRQNRTLLE
jgi:hypothetical protein